MHKGNIMADEKKQSIFREKSEEAINSPEKLDQYLRVTTPGVWAILLGVIVLLVGVCVWGVAGTLETSVSVAVVASDGKAAAYIPEDAVEAVVKSRTADVNGKTITLEPDALEPVAVTDSTNIYVREAGDLDVGDFVYEIPIKEELSDGIYSATVVTETISPVSLLLN